LRIQGVNGHLDIEVTETGHVQVSATEYVPHAMGKPEVSAVRLTDDGVLALTTTLEGAAFELMARKKALETAS
jgi:hypothetical protein